MSFVLDVFSRRILGWRAATSMTTPLVLDRLAHAIWTRQRDGVTDRFVDAGIDPSVGSVVEPDNDVLRL